MGTTFISGLTPDERKKIAETPQLSAMELCAIANTNSRLFEGFARSARINMIREVLGQSTRKPAEPSRLTF